MTISFYSKFAYIPTKFWNIYALLFKYTGKKILPISVLHMGRTRKLCGELQKWLRKVRTFLTPRALERLILLGQLSLGKILL